MELSWHNKLFNSGVQSTVLFWHLLSNFYVESSRPFWRRLLVRWHYLSLRMIFGNKKEFAVEAFHECFGEGDKHIFGRMCLWFGDDMLGDLHEPACLLGVTCGFFEDILDRITTLSSKKLSGLGDLEAYNYLDHKLYGHDDRTDAEVFEDSDKYSKFDFLTNGGESFDNSKSFIVADGFFLRVLFYNFDNNKFTGYKVSKLEFTNTIRKFVVWYYEVKSKQTRQSN